jgi:patatin-like phospholipase/acyl hydrolase
MDPETPLRILSLDGGGIRGISSLYILKSLLEQAEQDREAAARNIALRRQAPSTTTLRPCEIFDLICGTSTGGLIALLLGRLEMVRGSNPTSGAHADDE